MVPSVFVGTMSGTSLDGVTVAAASFDVVDGHDVTTYLGSCTVPYSEALRQRIASALRAASPAAIVTLRAELADRTVEAVRALCDDCGLAPESLTAVALHGQTLWHEPPLGSWQLSDPSRVAEQLGVGVVSDFRSRDIAAGGTGAPLVPLADALLFGHPERPRALLNIGGMANVTLVPQRGRLEEVRAFDTGPGVAVIDAVVRTLTGADFDRDGALAAAGRPIDALLTTLLSDPYFDLAPPKSTGRERFGAAFADRMIAECQRLAPQCTVADIVATATALTVRSIVGQCTRFVSAPLVDLLASGGGVHNRTLLEQLRASLAPVPILRFDDVFFDGDAKEAVAFAYLAWRHCRGLPGNVPSATGARGPRILGTWTPA